MLEIHLSRGDLDEARRLLARFDDLGVSADTQERIAYDAATAAVRLAEGNAVEALAKAEQAFDGRSALGIVGQDVKVGFLRGVEAALASAT